VSLDFNRDEFQIFEVKGAEVKTKESYYQPSIFKGESGSFFGFVGL